MRASADEGDVHCGIRRDGLDRRRRQRSPRWRMGPGTACARLLVQPDPARTRPRRRTRRIETMQRDAADVLQAASGFVEVHYFHHGTGDLPTV